MLIRIGKLVEVEVSLKSVYLRMGTFSRFYNLCGLPSGA
jgi:hypothetical protein